MRSQGFFIQLDNPIRSFFPGQAITGRVVVTNDKAKDFKYIGITFEGLANVHWTESRTVTTGTGKNRTTRNETVHYRAREDYFKCKIMLLGSESGTMTLPPGTTSYAFHFTLPINLPSSYTSKTGMVHYLMEARMKRAWNKADITSIVPFTVNGILDLNMEPNTALAISHAKQKNVCCLCCKSGPVGYKISLPKTGFVPGEFARFNGEFVNHSRRKVKAVKLSLMQRATFYARGKSKVEVKQICSANSPPIEPGEEDFWGGDILQIPPVPPTRLGGCRIIDVQYYLRFEMDLTGLTINLSVDIPITIGTIPFRNMFADFMPTSFPVPHMVPGFVNPGPGFSGDSGGIQGPPGPTPSAPVFDAYPDLPPPTYAEAMQVENFDYGNPADDGDIPEKGHGDDSTASEPSAPPAGFNFVPNYITYTTHEN